MVWRTAFVLCMKYILEKTQLMKVTSLSYFTTLCNENNDLQNFMELISHY